MGFLFLVLGGIYFAICVEDVRRYERQLRKR